MILVYIDVHVLFYNQSGFTVGNRFALGVSSRKGFNSRSKESEVLSLVRLFAPRGL